MSDAQVEVSPPVNGEGGEAPPQLPPDLPPPTPEEIVTPDIVDKIAKGYNPDCQVVDFSARMGTQIGDNYMSIMYAVDIQLKNRKSGEEEKLAIMLKTMPRNAMRQQMINDSGAFIKDANIYMEVIPRMVAFQKEKGLKNEEIFEGWPRCYITFHDGTSDYLAMEDLKVKGYKMANRLAGLDMEHAHIVLKNIAKFHAISFAMFGGDYDKIIEAYPWLEEKMFPEPDKVQEPMKMWMSSMFKNEADIVRKQGFPKEADMIDGIVNDQFWVNMNTLIGKRVKNAVINHGDCWTNNMLFLYDGDKPKSIKFVDFQLSRCTTRSIDLNYFLHSSIPIPNFNAKEEDMLKYYHDEFIRFVKRLGVEPSDHGLTWESFKEEYEDAKYYGVVMGFMLAPILSADSADVPDMETLKVEDFNEDGAKDFMNQLMGSKSDSTKKIVNLAVNHLPRCRQIAKK